MRWFEINGAAEDNRDKRGEAIFKEVMLNISKNIEKQESLDFESE